MRTRRTRLYATALALLCVALMLWLMAVKIIPQILGGVLVFMLLACSMWLSRQVDRRLPATEQKAGLYQAETKEARSR